jgi:hypothetical protein
VNASYVRCFWTWPFGHKWKSETRRDTTTRVREETKVLVCSRCGKESEVGKTGDVGSALNDLGDVGD